MSLRVAVLVSGEGTNLQALLDQVHGPMASFTADGAFDRDDVYAALLQGSVGGVP